MCNYVDYLNLPIVQTWFIIAHLSMQKSVITWNIIWHNWYYIFHEPTICTTIDKSLVTCIKVQTSLPQRFRETNFIGVLLHNSTFSIDYDILKRHSNKVGLTNTWGQTGLIFDACHETFITYSANGWLVAYVTSIGVNYILCNNRLDAITDSNNHDLDSDECLNLKDIQRMQAFDVKLHCKSKPIWLQQTSQWKLQMYSRKMLTSKHLFTSQTITRNKTNWEWEIK